MALDDRKKEKIARVVIKVLYSRFQSFPENASENRNAPFHEAFLKAFSEKLDGRVQDIPDYISLSSWLQGLNTSLGQTFFESVAQILCDGEKRDFKNKEIYSNQLTAITEIMTDLKNGEEVPSQQREDSIIYSKANGEKKTAPQFTADCFYETDNEVVAIELKSVHPNSGEMRGEKQKILQAKAVLSQMYPNKSVKYFFGFPFDPTSDSDDDIGYDKQRFLEYLVEGIKFLDQHEILIADEFWSFLANSENAMNDILGIINQIATPQFMDIYEQIQNIETIRDLNERKELFNNWYLFSESEIIDRLDRLSDNRSRRILRQQIFSSDGKYNSKRLELLQR